MGMDEPLLSIEGLTIRHGEHDLVKNVNLEIPRGQVVGLVGESGSGKTLTALSVPALLAPTLRITAGTITFHTGETPVSLNRLDKRALNRIRGERIGMIFQEPMTSLNPSIRCGEQAAETLRVHRGYSRKQARERILELFREVKLPDVRRIYRAWPHTLSGGQRQRVMIAQALATSPDLLIADEPTTALDVTVQKSILELLASLQQKYRLSVLFISHDLMVIKQIADRIAVMYRGEIVEENETSALLNHPGTGYTRGLLACKPTPGHKPYRLPTLQSVMQATSDKKDIKAPETEKEKPPVAGQVISNEPTNASRPEKNTHTAKSEPDQDATTNHKETLHSKEPLLRVHDLEVVFRGRRKKQVVRAVQSVSFDVFRGETLGLVGESGCGKTTLGRAILRLVEARSGQIQYDGIPLHTLSPSGMRKVRSRIQIVFQDPYSSLNPRMTAGSIITEAMRVHHLLKGARQRRERCVELLNQVGLPSVAAEMYPHQFSGGQRQRIGIARALACEPEFMVLDESVSALDVSVQAQVLNLLNDLKEWYGLTYIFISHDLTIVRYMSDRLIIMSDGTIVEKGDAETIYTNPQSPYTQKLLDSVPG